MVCWTRAHQNNAGRWLCHTTNPSGSTTLRKDDEVIHGNFFNQSSFATHALASEKNTVKVPDDVPLELLLGRAGGPPGSGRAGRHADHRAWTVRCDATSCTTSARGASRCNNAGSSMVMGTMSTSTA